MSKGRTKLIRSIVRGRHPRDSIKSYKYDIDLSSYIYDFIREPPAVGGEPTLKKEMQMEKKKPSTRKDSTPVKPVTACCGGGCCGGGCC